MIKKLQNLFNISHLNSTLTIIKFYAFGNIIKFAYLNKTPIEHSLNNKF